MMMRKLHFIALVSYLSLFFISSNALGQVAKIIYKNGTISAPAEVPFGQIVLLEGESEAVVSQIQVECIVLNEVKTYKIERGYGNHWTAKIGPFPIRSEIILTVRENRKLTQSEKTKIKDLVDEFIQILKTKGSFDENEFKQAMYDKLHTLNYRNEKGKNIDSIFIERVNIGVINNLNEGHKLDSQQLTLALALKPNLWITKTYKSGRKTALDSIMNSSGKVLDSISKAIGMDKATSKVLVDLFKKANDKYQAGLDSLSALANQLMTSITVSQSSTTGVDASGIQSYLGVDLGLIRFENNTSFFVTLHPYLVKTDPDKDYDFKWRNIGHIITPSLGIGIGSDQTDIKPVYFLGAGVRLNKVVRFAFGEAYFKKPDQTDYSWNLAFSASISVSYVSDLLKLITAAQAPLKP